MPRSHAFLTLALALLTMPLAADRKQAPKSSAAPKVKPARTVANAKEAAIIAERETGGEAVSSRRIPLNGATGGWEVDIRMPKGDRGYRCIIDCDTHMVHSKSLIPNPERSGRRR